MRDDADAPRASRAPSRTAALRSTARGERRIASGGAASRRRANAPAIGRSARRHDRPRPTAPMPARRRRQRLEARRAEHAAQRRAPSAATHSTSPVFVGASLDARPARAGASRACRRRTRAGRARRAPPRRRAPRGRRRRRRARRRAASRGRAAGRCAPRAPAQERRVRRDSVARASPGRIDASNSRPFALCIVITCTRAVRAACGDARSPVERVAQRTPVGDVAGALVRREQRDRVVDGDEIERVVERRRPARARATRRARARRASRRDARTPRRAPQRDAREPRRAVAPTAVGRRVHERLDRPARRGSAAWTIAKRSASASPHHGARSTESQASRSAGCTSACVSATRSRTACRSASASSSTAAYGDARRAQRRQDRAEVRRARAPGSRRRRPAASASLHARDDALRLVARRRGDVDACTARRRARVAAPAPRAANATRRRHGSLRVAEHARETSR